MQYITIDGQGDSNEVDFNQRVESTLCAFLCD